MTQSRLEVCGSRSRKLAPFAIWSSKTAQIESGTALRRGTRLLDQEIRSPPGTICARPHMAPLTAAGHSTSNSPRFFWLLESTESTAR